MRVQPIIFVHIFVLVSVHAIVRQRGLKWRNYDFIDNGLQNVDGKAETFPDKTKPSISCVLFGDVGCQGLCDVQCLLFGCRSSAQCRNGVYCECNEVYPLSSTRQVTLPEFEKLDIDTLWNYRFENSPTSTALLNQIKGDVPMKQYILTLLRNPHLTGHEIQKAMLAEYPQQLAAARDLQVIERGAKDDLVDQKGNLEYNNLGEYFYDLFDRLRASVRRMQYRARLKRLLNNIGSKEELEYVKKQIDLTGDETLKRFVDSYLQRRGINFDEDYQPVRPIRKRPFKKKWGCCKKRKGRFDDNSSSGSIEEKPRRKPKITDDAENESNLIEQRLLKEMIKSADEGEKMPPDTTYETKTLSGPSAGGKMFGGGTSFSKPFIGGQFPGGNSLQTSIEEKMNKQKLAMEEMAKKADKDDNGHTTYTFNSVSNNVVSTDVDGKKTKVEDSTVKNIEKDSDHPELNKDKQFDLNAVSLKDANIDLDTKLVETKDSDHLKGTTLVKERLKDGDKNFLIIHDGDNDGIAQASKVSSSTLEQMSPQQLEKMKNSMYYLVLDEDGNVVHTSNVEHEGELNIDQDHISQLMEKFPTSGD